MEEINKTTAVPMVAMQEIVAASAEQSIGVEEHNRGSFRWQRPPRVMPPV
ncbi:MAG: hypothetical protein ABFD81_12095 [Syntrophaceae bacterium]